MEEKKLTDEEIVKDIERSTGMPSYWKKIVLDLIHRLQDENKELKYAREVASKESKQFVEYATKINAEQKAEIERLKTFIDFQTANVMCEKCKERTVKDTAKEILKWLLGKAYVNKCIDLHINEVKAKFREEYGVEVE